MRDLTKPRMRVWKVVRMRLIVSACDAARDAWVGGGEKGVPVVRWRGPSSSVPSEPSHRAMSALVTFLRLFAELSAEEQRLCMEKLVHE